MDKLYSIDAPNTKNETAVTKSLLELILPPKLHKLKVGHINAEGYCSQKYGEPE
ncbi:protein of unknown function [Methanocaldococcus lauensis]|uniref:Uncharacterized protein n=1 Tax=Methanocaldococcus lauensis TaxID=2546128 RepID=A0A8D6PS84_9EURY|nr:protein of unknown function [Methanocaldococcus lauensis]